MTDRDRDAARHTLQVAGLQERIEELHLEIARLRRENAALRVELCEFAAARAAEVARDVEARASRTDDVPTLADTPRSRVEHRATPRLPSETMAEVVDGRLR